MGENKRIETQTPEKDEEKPSRIMFIFHGFGGLMKEFQVQNVSPDQLLYLAKWLEWYSIRVKDYSEMEKVKEKAKILKLGQDLAIPGDVGRFN